MVCQLGFLSTEGGSQQKLVSGSNLFKGRYIYVSNNLDAEKYNRERII